MGMMEAVVAAVVRRFESLRPVAVEEEEEKGGGRRGEARVTLTMSRVGGVRVLLGRSQESQGE